MKRWLILSALLNLALIAAVIRFVPSQSPAPAQERNSTAGPLTHRTNRFGENESLIRAVNWRMVESEDYRTYIANLRAIGCPEETVRDIITADVNQLFGLRRRQASQYRFWRNDNFYGNAEQVKQAMALWSAKRALLKELLGSEPEDDDVPSIFVRETTLAFLPPAKMAQVLELETLSAATITKEFSGVGRIPNRDAKMREMKQELEAEIAKVLTPLEFEEYQLRNSDTARALRSQLGDFDITEQEFRSIFKVRKEFDDLQLDSRNQWTAYSAAEREMLVQVKNILGEARFAEYQRAQDYFYKEMLWVAERNGLDKDAAIRVYEIKKAAEAEARRIQGDKSVSSEERSVALDAVRSQTETAARGVFGQTGWKAYLEQPEARWLTLINGQPLESLRQP